LNPEALYAAFDAIAGNPERAREMATRARETA
jgi:hypothetical protein